VSRRTPAHARSKKYEAKKARRNKRRAAQGAIWIPQELLDDTAENLELVDVLERFDELVTLRGWVFSEELSDEDAALWYWPASMNEDDADDEAASVTTIVMFADDDAEIANVMFVGTNDGYAFATEELLGQLATVEAYRLGDQLPEFNTS
jgi:hypothetical protein